MTCDKHWTEGARITDDCYSCDVRAEMATPDLSVVEALRREEDADPEAGAGALLCRAAKHVIGHLDGWLDVEQHDDDYGSTFVNLFRDARLAVSSDCADDLDDYLYRDRYKVAARRVSDSSNA
jgi:hypothetical protein